MSWSYKVKGLSLVVARDAELEGEKVQKTLSGNPKEKALHARVLSLIICACHEQPDGAVEVNAYGHQSGSEQNLFVSVNAVSKDLLYPQPEPQGDGTGESEPVTESMGAEPGLVETLPNSKRKSRAKPKPESGV